MTIDHRFRHAGRKRKKERNKGRKKRICPSTTQRTHFLLAAHHARRKRLEVATDLVDGPADRTDRIGKMVLRERRIHVWKAASEARASIERSFTVNKYYSARPIRDFRCAVASLEEAEPATDNGILSVPLRTLTVANSGT